MKRALPWLSGKKFSNPIESNRKLVRAIRAGLEQLEVRRLFANPVSDPGGPYTVNEGSSVAISGSGSSDDGSIVSYKWDLNYNASLGFRTSITGMAFTYNASDGPLGRTIALRVTDDEGNITTNTAGSLTVNNVQPTITLTGASSVDEGNTCTLNWTKSDPGQDTISGWTIDWGDGSSNTSVAGNVSTATHIYDTPDTPTITVTATDEDGATTQTKNITVNTVNPVVTILGDASVGEGEQYTIFFDSSDAGGDTREGWIIDWGDGEITFNDPGISSLSHNYDDNGSYTVSATAIASDGDSDADTINLTVNNLAPTVAITGAPSGEVNEGAALNFGSTVSDVAADTLTYGWTVYKDGQSYALPGGTDITSSTFSFTPTDNGTYSVRLTVEDEDGGSTTVNSDEFTVVNVDPTASISGEPVGSIVEGTAVNLSVSAADDSDDDTFSYYWSVTKNGDEYLLPENTVLNTANFSFTPTDNGTYVATVVVADDDGGGVQVSSDDIVVTNANPTGTVTGEPVGSIEEGTEVSLTATPADVGAADTFTYSWSVEKDGNPFTLPGEVDTDNAGFAFTPTDEGDYVATCVITDDDGGFVLATSGTITVTNANPAASISGEPESFINEGSLVSLSAVATDGGANDTLSYSWSVEKNGNPYALPGGTTVDEADFNFIPTDNGTYVATVTITDDDGGSTTLSTGNIVVANVLPEIEFTGVPGGSVAEGTAISVGSSITDPGTDDTLTYAWSVLKDGNPYALPGGTDVSSASFSFTPTDNGTYIISLTVEDDDGGSTSYDTPEITVTNATPTVAISGEPGAAIDEGDSISLTATPTDAGEDDTFSYQWTATLDGEEYEFPGGTTTSGATLTFNTRDDGAYVFNVTITDDDGGENTDTSSTVTVNNVNPGATVSGEPVGSVAEGSSVTVSVAGTDAGADDSLIYSWSVTKDSNPFTLPGDAVTNETDFTFIPTDDGTYVATVVVTDDDGGTMSVDSANITVTNANPTGSLEVDPTGTRYEGSAIYVTAVPADAGTDDTFTYSWSVEKDGNPFVLPGGTTTDEAEFAFTPTDDGDYVATVTISDDDGGSVNVSTSTLEVENTAPVPTITGAPGSADEGDTLSFGSSVFDAGDEDTVASYSWSVTKDGQAFALPGGTDTSSSAFSFVPTDNGDYAVTLTVTDDDGGSDTATEQIEVGNVAPTGAISGEPVGNIDEGTAVNLTATPADAGDDDTFSYAWSVTRDGSAFALPGGTDTSSASFSFTPTDNGSYIATCVITDDDGGSVSVDSDSITVDNVDPTATISGEPVGSIDEGDSVTLTVTPADAGAADTFSYSWSVSRNGSPFTLPEDAVTDEAEFTFTTTDNGDYTATVVVTDDDGGTVSVDSAQITAGNVAPTGSITGAPATSEEGAEITLTAVPADAGSEDTFTYSWSVEKDGNPYALPGGTDTTSSTLSFTPTDNGDYVATVVITDDDAGAVTVVSDTITVTNVAPDVTLAGSSTVNEGSSASITTSVTDAGEDDTVFTYAWSVTRDGEAFTLPGGTNTSSANFSFTPTDNGNYVVTVVVTDDDGGETTKTRSITVNNVNPNITISGVPGTSITEGTAVNVSANATDAGADDTLSYEWSVKKNGSAFALPGGTNITSTNFSFTPTDNGSFTITAMATDDDGGSGLVTSTAITVTNVAPTGSVTGEPGSSIVEGDSLTLSAAASDAGSADTFNYSWSVTRNGSAYSLSGVTTNASSLTFSPNDEGTYVASVVITDDDGASVTATSDAISATNANPTASITGLPDGNASDEGTAINLSATASDAGSTDTLSYAWAVTKDGDAFDSGTSSTFGFTPDDNGTYVVTLTVTDNDGGSVTLDPETITVSNVTPTVSITGLPESINEGDEVSLGLDIDDASTADTTAGFDIAWTVTLDGDAFTSGTGSTLDFTATDNGEYAVSVSVSDKDDAAGIDTGTIVAANVDPEAEITGAPSSAAEGYLLELSSTVTDAGSADETEGFSYVWSVTRDGEAFALSGDAETANSTFDFIATDNGEYVVSLTVTDKDGADVTTTESIDITNVAPTDVAISGAPDGASEGETIELTGSADDAGAEDSLVYDWTVTKNGSAFAEGSSSEISFTPNDNGTYVVTLIVSDDDDATASPVTETITVTNVDPSGTITATSTGVRGRETTFAATISDAGSADAEAVVVDWGDGSDDEVIATNASASRNFSHIYASVGTFPVTMTISDDDGGTETVTTTVTIKAAAVQTDPMDSSKTALIVGGTSDSDSIKFSMTSAGRVKVLFNGESLGTFAPTGHIIAYGEGGTNNMIVDAAVTVPAVFYGGSGKDIMQGGSGNDILIGRKGNDVLLGNAGRDLIVAGVGIDSIEGGAGEDILMGGSTAGAESFSVLDAITDEWNRTDAAFANRVKHLKGTLSGGLNGSNKLTDGTVFEDANPDTMGGGSNKDWFFTNTLAGTIEKINDFSAVDDIVTNVVVGVSSKPKA